MPLYEYQCLPNHHRFEVRQSIKDDPLDVCPDCGGPVRRVIHPVGIVFKGSGFYATDSRKSSSSSKPPASSESKAPDTQATDKKSDTTPPVPAE